MIKVTITIIYKGECETYEQVVALRKSLEKKGAGMIVEVSTDEEKAKQEVVK